ncbi:E3 ubiquitin-protein ligase RNF167-like [Elgaria multicarinata webbii]|uniref:E3 ubiquitin-protein ligase RNF167-like n=1 Tax=Elgaria multicarinata webbii TaxID=159646 RepID=UPI002FCCD9D0
MWSPLSPLLRMVTVFLILQVPTANAFIHAVCSHNSTTFDFGALPALFGPPLPARGLTGFLIEAMPADACQPIEGPPNTSSIFVALIHRHDCSFATKVLHAQQAGFRGAIVHNVDSQTLVNMVSEVSIQRHVHIPSVFTADVASKILKQLHRSGELSSVVLVPEYFHFTWKGSSGMAQISSSSPCRCHIQLPGPCSRMTSLRTCWMICIPVSTLIACLLIEKYLSMCKKRKTWRRTPRFLENGSGLVRISFTSSKYQECAICLDRYMEHDSLKVLSCSHAFHSKCIDLWHISQTRSKTCPLCMQKVKVVTRLQAVRLWKDGTRENNWTLWSGKGKPASDDQHPCLLLSQRLPPQF